MLEPKPEPIESICGRFSSALIPVWDANRIRREIREGKDPDRPGCHRTHVFDFISGLRLIVSREWMEEIGVFLHISSSWGSDGTARLETPGDFLNLLKASLNALKISRSGLEWERLHGNVFHQVFTVEYTRQVCAKYGVSDEVAETPPS